ncbi:hypothetical protein ACPOL_3256 [Acidisarcina polymorpha]|uniref:Uncharacterized protein n=1 Tax=Acidisarcina polymorpha TaxID=2211140 RepID=A0A2Z5G0I2_9BACT|nr:hypothetical protein ACPOL_3256 [Acidisarcina polymorpha]
MFRKKLKHRGDNPFQVRLERKMASGQKRDRCVRDVLFEGLSSGGTKYGSNLPQIARSGGFAARKYSSPIPPAPSKPRTS